MIIVSISELLATNISVYAGIIRLLSSILTTFILTFLFEASILHRFFFSVSFQAIYVLSEFISQIIVQYILKISDENLSHMSDSIIFLTSSLAIFFIILASLLIKKERMYLSSRHSILLLVAPIITILATFNRTIIESTIHNPLSYAFLVSGFLIINYVNFFLLILSAKAFEEKEKNQYLKQQNEYQNEKYNQLSSSYRKLRSYQHDTKKRFLYISECVKSHNYDCILPYLNDSLNDLNSSYSRINTGNLVIDSFISNYSAIFEEKNIEFFTDLKLDSTLIPVSDYDLSIIIGNLLDNAINACNAISPSEKRYIKLYIYTDTNTDQFIIHSINSKNQTNNPVFTNDLSHGYGLLNINKHIESLFGLINTKESAFEYEITIVVPLAPPPKNKEDLVLVKV